MSKKFAEYSKFDLSNVNKEVLKKWQDGDIFHKSLEIREGHPSFVFYEGPPSANGMPGIHHVIARSIKDIFCRYKTIGRRFPSLSIIIKGGTPLAFATRSSSAPKVGAICTIPVPSSTVT